MMTDIKLPSPEEKMMAQQQAQMMAQQQQPLPRQLEEILEKPTWEECMQVLRDDKQRSYRVDIETDSTIAGDQAMDQKSMTELLTGVSTFITNAGPAVAAGYLPLEAAKAMLMSAVRRFRMGREVEDALDMIGENEDGAAGDGQEIQAQQQQEQAVAAQAEQMKIQMEQQNSAIKAQEAQQKAQIEQDKMQLDAKVQQASLMIQEQEIGLKERDMALREFEAQKPDVDQNIKIQADMQMAREKMEFEASEADKQRQVDLAKAIMAEFNGPEINTTSPEDASARASEIMARINEVVSATRGIGGVPLEETTVMAMDDNDENFIEPVLQ
jgi:hypothetical protein